MQIGEAITLDRDDVDLAGGVLTIREAKFGHSRLVPLHPSATDALASYAACRDRSCPNPRSSRFFLSKVGTALRAEGVHLTFNQLTTTIGLRTATARPQVHDYADLRIMPTSTRGSLVSRASVLDLSA